MWITHDKLNRVVIPWLILPLISCLIFFVVVLSLTFHDWKVSKRSRHWQKQSFCVLLTSRKRHSSVTQNLPQTTFRSNIGGKRTRFSRINSNTQCTAQTAFALSPLFKRLFVVFLIVPVFFGITSAVHYFFSLPYKITAHLGLVSRYLFILDLWSICKVNMHQCLWGLKNMIQGEWRNPLFRHTLLSSYWVCWTFRGISTLLLFIYSSGDSP